MSGKQGREGRMRDDRKTERRKQHERMKGKAKQGGKGSTPTVRGRQGGDGRMKDKVEWKDEWKARKRQQNKG